MVHPMYQNGHVPNWSYLLHYYNLVDEKIVVHCRQVRRRLVVQ